MIQERRPELEPNYGRPKQAAAPLKPAERQTQPLVAAKPPKPLSFREQMEAAGDPNNPLMKAVDRLIERSNPNPKNAAAALDRAIDRLAASEAHHV